MTTVESFKSTSIRSFPPPVNYSPPDRKSRLTTYVPPAVPSPPVRGNNREPPHCRLPEAVDLQDVVMASDEFGQWYFTETELENTPSILNGISTLDERCRRAKGVNFILQAGMILKLPQVTLGCASVFFNRFFMRHSMIPEKGGIHHYNLAATALFLATKSEENCRKTKEIVIAVAKVAQKNASYPVDEQSKEYWRWRDSILLYEELMLEQLTFDVVLQSPYNLLMSFLPIFGLDKHKPLRNLAWSFINDSILTILCLMMPPKDIAIAALYFGARMTGEVIADIEDLPWWEYLGGRPGKIGRATKVLNDFWRDNPLKKDFPYAPSPAASSQGGDLERTRARTQPASSREMTPHEGSASQNGHAPKSPSTNGNATGSHQRSQLEDQVREVSSSRNATRESSSGLRSPKVDLSGSSDAVEKAIANDPATHMDTETSSLAQPTISGPITPPKRKALELEDDEEPSSKRKKSETAGDGNGNSVLQTGEDGELES